MERLRNKIKFMWFCSKLSLTMLIIGVLIGQFMHPIPLVKSTALPKYSKNDALPYDINDSGFEIGYTDQERNDMDNLIKEAIVN